MRSRDWMGIALNGALALGAGNAQALSLPSTGSSDLVLVVEDTVTGSAYALDINVSINAELPTGGLVTGAILNDTLGGVTSSIAASTTLSKFLGAGPAADFGWTLEAAQFSGGTTATTGNSRTPGATKVIFSSMIGTMNPSTVSGQVLAPLVHFANGYNADVNGGGLADLRTATETGTATYSATAAQKYGFFGTSDLAPLGATAQTLFGFTGNGSTGTLQSYVLGAATLSASGAFSLTDAGTSKAKGGAPVPLPPAFWLLGPAVIGLLRLGRR